MPLILRNFLWQPRIIPFATTADAGLMSAADKAKLDALGSGPTTPCAPLVIPRLTNDPIVIPDATPTSDGVMSAADKAKLDSLGPVPSTGAPFVFRGVFGVQPQFIPGASPVASAIGGLLSATDKGKLDGLSPGGSWTEKLIASNAGVQEVWGVSDNEVYASDRANVYKYNGTLWAPTGLVGVSQINALWGVSGSVWAMGGIHLRNSTDGGANWTDHLNPIAGWSNGQAIWGTPDGVTIYISGSYPGHSAAVLVSSNSGASWALAFDQPNGNTVKGIYGYAANDLYVVSFNNDVYHWNGAALTQVEAGDGDESSFACWGPATGQIYWVTDTPVLPVKQVMHAVGASVFAESGPWVTNGGAAPDDEVWGISGKDASHIYAAGFNDNGAKAYKISVPNNAGPGTWVLDALPNGADTDPGAQALQVWVNPSTGFVCMVGQRSNGDGVSWTK